VVVIVERFTTGMVMLLPAGGRNPMVKRAAISAASIA
jgi:hypothetical protein